jgi:hypothetical protein
MHLDVTLSGSQDEPWRVARLQRVLGAVLAKAPWDVDVLIGLYDQKGELVVECSSMPSLLLQRRLREAWQDVGEPAELVDFEIVVALARTMRRAS